MTTMQQDARTSVGERKTDCDAVVVGAGFAGIYMLKKLRDDLGLDVRVIESGSDVGGVWYWNKYPGARTDSESQYYCYSFDRELYGEWPWKERYPSGEEVQQYLSHVADRFDLRRDIDFNRYVKSVVWDEGTGRWTITTDTGEVYRAPYFISAMGILSAPYRPDIKGLDTFKGQQVMTAMWPRDGVDLAGKRVGVIGTGSTGIQLVPEAAKVASQVYVFQRTPNYVVEAQNRQLTDADRKWIRDNYDLVWGKVHSHPFAMAFDSPNRLAVETSEEEREKIFEEGWEKGGFRFLFETFDDLMVDEKANEAAAEYLRNKIRSIVKDPVTAEKLTPRGYPLGGKRLPAGHGYYEAFNRDNVTLVDVKSAPIQEVNETGLRTADGQQYDLDVLVIATGFDAFSGALTRVDVRGVGGQDIKSKWARGPRTLFGLTVHGFPNLFAVGGPQTPFANNPPGTEKQVEWIAAVIQYLRDHDYTRVEPTREAEDAWVAHTNEIATYTLASRGGAVGSWISGANIPGKEQVIQVYFGGADAFNAKLAECQANNFNGLQVSS
jgi:cation diffusion facilitator CzcD-associated flavoprotein CzcO